jgi:hypothetical protein
MSTFADPEFLKALAALISAVAWPLLLGIIIWLARNELLSLIRSIESLTFPGGGVNFRKELNKIILESQVEKSAKNRFPTEQQFKAAERIGHLARHIDLSAIRDQLSAFAAEYERIRATMQSGDERTRRMEVVVAKIRTLAIAALPLLDELSTSHSPGHRLATVAILQVTPDPRYIDWLAERFARETPFVSYHAAVALLTAARMSSEEIRPKILAAIHRAKELLGAGNDTTDRFQVLDTAERELIHL